jgi:hypothetical protein
VVAGVGRRFAGRERFARAAFDAFAVVFFEAREVQLRFAGVFDDDLLVDGLADFAAQR